MRNDMNRKLPRKQNPLPIQRKIFLPKILLPPCAPRKKDLHYHALGVSSSCRKFFGQDFCVLTGFQATNKFTTGFVAGNLLHAGLTNSDQVDALFCMIGVGEKRERNPKT